MWLARLKIGLLHHSWYANHYYTGQKLPFWLTIFSCSISKSTASIVVISHEIFKSFRLLWCVENAITDEFGHIWEMWTNAVWLHLNLLITQYFAFVRVSTGSLSKLPIDPPLMHDWSLYCHPGAHHHQFPLCGSIQRMAMTAPPHGV